MIGFWQLPAPTTFLRGVVEDLREGNNVIIAIPDHAPVGWPNALRASLADPTLPRLEELRPDGVAPIPALYEQLALGRCSARASVNELCTNGGFQSRLLYLQRFTPSAWLAWSDFLFQYEDACRHLDLCQRTLFIAAIHGDLAAQAPRPANLLRIHLWCDKMDGVNARLYAANLLAGSNLPHWKRQLTVALLSELALWDPEVLDLGASLPLQDLIEPVPWLSQLATARQWSPADDLRSPLAQWHGYRQPFEGHHRIHSAWLALSGRHQALAQRVWAGQVGALFPLLERHRRSLLARYKNMLLTPWPTQFGYIQGIEDLELNHIADQLKSQSNGGLRNVYEFTCWLRDIRNDLAHLAPIPPVRLLDPRFEKRMDNVLAGEDD